MNHEDTNREEEHVKERKDSAIRKLLKLDEPKANEGKCIWYGTCDNNPDPGKEDMLLNCEADIDAPPLTDPYANMLLQQFCPDMISDIGKFQL